MYPIHHNRISGSVLVKRSIYLHPYSPRHMNPDSFSAESLEHSEFEFPTDRNRAAGSARHFESDLWKEGGSVYEGESAFVYKKSTF